MKRILLILAAFVLILEVSACTRPQIDLPNRDVPVTQEAAQRFEEKIAQLKQAPGGDIKITFTESEITSYINIKLAENNLPVQRPTIWFSSGKIYIKGRFETSGIPLKGDAVLVLMLSVQDGKLNLKVEKAVVGRVPVPQSVLDELTSLANERLTTITGPLPVKELQILEGEAILILSR